MPFVSNVTAGFMPKDSFHRPTRQWPTPRQKPYLEQIHDRC